MIYLIHILVYFISSGIDNISCLDTVDMMLSMVAEIIDKRLTLYGIDKDVN